MTAGNPQPTPPVDLADAERYLLRDPREVVRVLQALIDNRALISAHLMPGGLPCPTALLELADGQVLIDGNRQEAINQRMAGADYLVCVSQLDRVRIQFRLQGLQRIDGDGPVAFRAPAPDAVMQLQRRELYRLELIPGPPVTLQVPPPAEGRPELSARALDLSGGGMAVAVRDEDQGRFAPGSQIDGCTVTLPDGGPPMPVRLQVAHVSRGQLLAGFPVRVGCRFVGLPRNAEQRILQYIFQVERQRNARERRAV